MKDIHQITKHSRLDYLDALRAFAVCMVVAIHARAYVNLTPETEQLIKPLVTLIAVPIFFLCDGFLFVHARMLKQKFEYRRYLINSIRRLIMPWVLFSLLYLVARWIFEAAGVVKQEFVVGQDPTSVLVEVYGSAIAPQMYFLLSLFLIRSLTFIFRHLATVPTPIVWIVFLAYSFVFREIIANPLRSAIPIDLDPARHALWGLQYYLLGAVLARHHVQFGKSAKALFCATLSACCLTLAISGIEGSPVIFQYSYILCAYFAFLAAVARESSISRMGQHSMGIYLLHAPVLLKGVSAGVLGFIPQPVLSYFAVITIVTAVAYWVTLFIGQIPYGTLVFGEMPNRLK